MLQWEGLTGQRPSPGWSTVLAKAWKKAGVLIPERGVQVRRCSLHGLGAGLAVKHPGIRNGEFPDLPQSNKRTLECFNPHQGMGCDRPLFVTGQSHSMRCVGTVLQRGTQVKLILDQCSRQMTVG